MEAERSRELDPISLIINSVLGLVYYFAERYDESIANHKRALELEPNFLPGNAYAILAYVANGMCDRAIETMNRVKASAAGDAYTLSYFGYAYGVCGQEEDALRILDTLNKMARVRYVSPMHGALVLLGLGRLDEALDSLDEAHLERSPSLVVGRRTPVYEPLLSDPRYKEQLRKIGLED
jgi:tetratricopeptide (TPR) repeat protein